MSTHREVQQVIACLHAALMDVRNPLEVEQQLQAALEKLDKVLHNVKKLERYAKASGH